MQQISQKHLGGPITRATVRTSLVLGLRLFIQAGTLLLVARMLGPAQFGSFVGVASLAVVLGTLATFGSHLILIGEVSRDPAQREQVICWALPVTIFCSSLLTFIFLAICTLFLRTANLPNYILLAIGITEIFLQPLIGLAASEHHALERIARSQLLASLPLGLRLVAALAVLISQTPDPLASYIAGYLFASLVALLLATTTMPAPWPSPRKWRLPNIHEFQKTAGFAVLNVTAISPVELDKTLAIRLLSLDVAGAYAAGSRIISAATLPILAMMLSAMPRLFREGQAEPKRTANLLRWIFGTSGLYGFLISGVLWLSTPLLVLVFGAKFHLLDYVIHWLCLAVPALSMRTAAGAVLVTLGKPWVRVSYEAVGIMLLITASIMLVANRGILGMPLALACAEWTMAALGWAYIHSITKRTKTKEFS